MIKALIFVFVGIVLVVYVYYKRKKKEKSYNDWNGYIGGFGSIVFGIYLIIEAFKN